MYKVKLKKKVHPKVVQEILGHAQIGITMNVYSHVLPGGIQEEAINELNAVLQGQQKASGKRRRKTVV